MSGVRVWEDVNGVRVWGVGELKSTVRVCGEWKDVSGVRVWEDANGARVWGVGCEWYEGVGSGRIEERCEGVWGVEGCEWCEGV